MVPTVEYFECIASTGTSRVLLRAEGCGSGMEWKRLHPDVLPSHNSPGMKLACCSLLGGVHSGQPGWDQMGVLVFVLTLFYEEFLLKDVQ